MMVEENGHELSLSVSKVKNIGHNVNGRISGDAARRVAYQEERRVYKVFKAAKEVANSAGRETIKEEDIITVYQIKDIIDE